MYYKEIGFVALLQNNCFKTIRITYAASYSYKLISVFLLTSFPVIYFTVQDEMLRCSLKPKRKTRDMFSDL